MVLGLTVGTWYYGTYGFMSAYLLYPDHDLQVSTHFVIRALLRFLTTLYCRCDVSLSFQSRLRLA